MIKHFAAGRFAIAVSLALLSCCSFISGGKPHLPRATLSPNGEPLVGAGWPPHCEDALDAWFDRIDTNHDGKVTLAELDADADRQFRAMDLNHDGKVSAAEVQRYRQSVMGNRFASISTPEIAARPLRPDRDNDRDAYPGGSRRGDSAMPRPDAAGTMPADQPDPVMSADTDLDGSVTWDEFRTLVHQNFADFDKDREGAFEKSALRKLCHGID